MNVLIVDDHKIVRDGVRLYVEKHPKVKTIEEAKNGNEALAHLRQHPVDLVLIDINMAVLNGIDSTTQITKEFENVKVIALTMHNDYHHIKSMMDAGASGYLLKNCNQSEMIEAIDRVMDNEIFYSPEVAQTVMNNLAKKKVRQSNSIPLTPRELDIYKLIMDDKSNQEIADELFISIRTVEVHKRNLMEKTGAKSSAGLVIYAVKNRIFDDII
ncbi:response regulator transcription factor [Fulvivirga lutea]|uniref:Response regulator transcription factor n=1 Tax=Fulvivirga lutea TaxID=2810512 RepID=A0A974WKC7_9BACT|nr:response regulator transcription factor [Fulvivirga lutea]QSE98762.1 response regulator transcription factor [Fulvivirga lutea]